MTKAQVPLQWTTKNLLHIFLMRINFIIKNQITKKKRKNKKKKKNLKAGLDFFFAKFFFPSIPSSYCLIHSFQSSQWLPSKCFRNAKIPFVDL